MKSFLKTGLAAVLILFLCAACAGSPTETASAVRFLVDEGETILPWEDPETDCLYVFLPSYADMSRIRILFSEESSVLIDEVPAVSGTDCSSFETGRSYPFSSDSCQVRHIMFLQSANVAALFLTTGEGVMEEVHADKEHEEKVSIALFTSDGVLDYQSRSGDEIKGRGHSTWYLDKKPYNLKLKKPEPLLGMTPAKKWSLLANGYDESNLRTKLVLDSARRIAPYDGFSPECAYTDVYINGEYNGLYLLCRSKKDTVSLFLDGSDKDAFELELTTDYKIDSDCESIEISRTNAVQIHKPSPATDEQHERLESILGSLEAWIFTRSSGNSSLPVDPESWARKILVEAVFDNYDGAKSSQFFWGSLTDGIIFAGPCWDYDLTMGSYYGISWSTPCAFMAFNDWNKGEDQSWYHGIWTKPEIRERALAVYQEEFRELLQYLLDYGIDEEAAVIASSAGMDRIRWPGLRSRYGSFEEAVHPIKAFLLNRLAFLDDIWLKGGAYHKIVMKLPESVVLNHYVPDGEAWKDAPNPADVIFAEAEKDGDLAWYREDTDELFDVNSLITGDITLYAKGR